MVLAHGVCRLQVLPHLAGNQLRTLLENEVSIEVFGVVLPLFNGLTQLVDLAFLWGVAHCIGVGGDSDDLVGREKSVLDALLERVRVDGLTEVLVVELGILDDTHAVLLVKATLLLSELPSDRGVWPT